MAEDMAVLIVVDSMEKAEQYRTIMEDHDIPVEIGDDEDLTSLNKVVLVPEDMLEEAKYIINQAEVFVDEAESEFDTFDDDELDDEDDFSEFSPIDDDDDFDFDDDDDDDDDDDFDDDDDGYRGFGSDDDEYY